LSGYYPTHAHLSVNRDLQYRFRTIVHAPKKRASVPASEIPTSVSSIGDFYLLVEFSLTDTFGALSARTERDHSFHMTQ
jgi:hypothetical protein